MTASDNHPPKKAVLIITPPDKRKTRKEYAESDSAFRKMATTSRQQLYDLANPGKQLIKQLSTAGMAKEAYANLMPPWEAINQNAVDALSVNPMVAHVNSVLEETINQNAANALCLNTAAAHADSVFQEAINQAATISTLNINAAIDAHKVFDAYNTSQCVDSLAAERLSKQISVVAGVDFDSAKALAEKIGTIPNLKELSAMVGLDSATALAEKINPKVFDAAALGMATLPQPESFLPIVNSKEERKAAKNEELNRRFRESSKRMWEMQDQQERIQKQLEERQKEIAKQAYLEAFLEYEAKKQTKEARPQVEALANIGVGNQVLIKPAGTMATPIFSEFTNLRANEISLVIMESGTAKIVIRGKSIKVNPDELGLKAGSKDWKLLAGAAVNQGCLVSALKMLNSSSDLETEKGKIKTTVSRLRKSLKDAMGLKDNPIQHISGNGYKFTFKAMTHELLKGSNVSNGDDAMDYVNGDDFDDNQRDGGFWCDDE